MNKEIRNFSSEMNVSDDGRHISGYAAIFDSRSRDMGFFEYIDKGAFDGVIENSDVFATFNHSMNDVLARSNKGKGSLSLSIDDIGLRYEFDAPDTNLGKTVSEHIKRGDLTASSFAFTVLKDRWEHRGDEYIRHIEQIDRLYDVSPVWTPAYEATSVSCRSFDEFKKQEELREAEEMGKNEEVASENSGTEVRSEEQPEEEPKNEEPKPDLTEYYKEIKAKYNV